jgi:ectoine hydroxylase-related dioxygenase (phytanoyl-CoA dioxygenase family)
MIPVTRRVLMFGPFLIVAESIYNMLKIDHCTGREPIGEWSMRESLSAPYEVSAGQANEYRRDGHLLLKHVATKEDIDAVRPMIMGVVDKIAHAGESQGRISDYSKMFTQTTNVWRQNEAIREFIFARRFARIAADLMGVNGVRLYHDQALVKEPGGKKTPWHQDYYYWPLATEHTVTMWMPLVDVTPEMGSMSFVLGSHVSGAYDQLPISETSQDYFERIIHREQSGVRSYSLNAGDATFHSGRTLHAAHANASAQRREIITIIYYAEGTRIMEPDNQHRKVDMEVFHPGQKPGDLAASELNPLLFSRA